MKDAMKAKESGKQKLSVIRLVRGAIRQLEIDGKQELQDEDVLGVISKEVKQRRDSIEDFKKGGRDDLVAAAEAEIAILMEYLPQQLSEDEVRQITRFRRGEGLLCIGYNHVPIAFYATQKEYTAITTSSTDLRMRRNPNE